MFAPVLSFIYIYVYNHIAKQILTRLNVVTQEPPSSSKLKNLKNMTQEYTGHPKVLYLLF